MIAPSPCAHCGETGGLYFDWLDHITVCHCGWRGPTREPGPIDSLGDRQQMDNETQIGIEPGPDRESADPRSRLDVLTVRVPWRGAFRATWGGEEPRTEWVTFRLWGKRQRSGSPRVPMDENGQRRHWVPHRISVERELRAEQTRRYALGELRDAIRAAVEAATGMGTTKASFRLDIISGAIVEELRDPASQSLY